MPIPYQVLWKEWRTYKADTILKVCKTEDAFREQKGDDEAGDLVPEYLYKDIWSDYQMSRYSDILDKLQEVLEAKQV